MNRIVSRMQSVLYEWRHMIGMVILGYDYWNFFCLCAIYCFIKSG